MRHLEYMRDEPFLKAMEAFVKTTLGNGYNISIRNLIFRRRSLKSSSGRATEVQPGEDIEQRDFFCSELIAKAFKEAGLLASDEASHTFMPADFSNESKRLKLEKGARLGEEMMIRFDEQALKREREEYEKGLAEMKTD